MNNYIKFRIFTCKIYKMKKYCFKTSGESSNQDLGHELLSFLARTAWNSPPTSVQCQVDTLELL